MSIDVEETLVRELHEVAAGLEVPSMPRLPQEPPQARWIRQPLLVAAVVVLIVAAVATVATSRGGRELQPAPPAPSPTRTGSTAELPRTAPTVPYVLDQRLYVDGEQVPGSWWSVEAGDAGWIAIRTDNTWWWGRGAQPNAIEGQADAPLVISPNGKYVAETLTEDGQGMVTGFDTGFSGEGMGGIPVDLGDTTDGSAVTVRAVTDDGRVIAQGTGTAVLWLPFVDNSVVDLTRTVPGQQVLAETPAGLVVTDGDGGEPYLAEISDAGEITRIGAAPAHDDLISSPGGEWLAWTPEGTTGGEVTSIRSLEAQRVDGTGQVTLSAPDGWAFRVRAYAWEDDDHLVSPVVGARGERMARCSVGLARCVLVDAD